MSDAKDVTIDSAPGPLPSTEKSSIVFNSNAVDTPPAIGELTFEEYTSGGLGRHLGVFSTICLMYAIPRSTLKYTNKRTELAASLELASSLPPPPSQIVWEVSVHRCFSGSSDCSSPVLVYVSGLSLDA
ncbi:hypothetical protein MAP00_004323 [Monascus purpureus]|nr:hypothetical protein MAP00_004323 [Monascus purpureus]